MSRPSSTQVAPILRENAWNWTAPFKTCLITALACTMYDFINLSRGDSENSDLGQYGLVSNIRELRRVKTPLTYARKRGQLISASISGFHTLTGRGVGEVEDSIGGIISGPMFLWRNGKVEVKNRPKHKIPNITLTHFKLENDAYWDNGRQDEPCVDREVAFSGEDYPEENEDDKIGQSNTLMFGYLPFNCSLTVQSGYFAMIYSAEHGAAMSGQVYAFDVNLSLADIPKDVNTPPSDDLLANLTLEEMGSFVENRGFSSRWNDPLKMLILILPLLCWSALKSRIGKVVVSLHTVVDGTNAVFNDMGHIEKDTMGVWTYPLGYLFLSSIFLLTESNRLVPNEETTIKHVSPEYHHYQLDFLGVAAFLISQEVFALLLMGLSYGMLPNMVVAVNKGVIYGYQRCKPALYALWVVNTAGCVWVIVDAMNVLEEYSEKVQVVYIIGSCVVILINGTITVWGIMNQAFADPTVLCLASQLEYASVHCRSIANLLTKQNKARDEKVALVTNEVAGCSYRGNLLDAIILMTPNLMFEAFTNGVRVEIKIVGKNAKVERSTAFVKSNKNHVEVHRDPKEHGQHEIIIG